MAELGQPQLCRQQAYALNHLCAAVRGFCTYGTYAYAVNETDADLLMLSVTNLTPKESQREIAAIEREVADRVRILVGGPAAKVPPGSRAEIQQDLALVEAGLSR